MATATDVITELREQDKSRAAEYRELARRLAADEQVDAGEVRSILDAAGKTPNELSRNVDRLQERAELQRQRATIPDIEARLVEAKQEIQRHTDKLQAAKQSHAAAVAPLDAEIREISRTMIALKGLSKELALSCPDESLVARHRSVQRTIPRLQNELQAARRHVHEREACLATASGDRQARVYRGQVERAREELDSISRRLAAAAAENEQLYQAMIDY